MTYRPYAKYTIGLGLILTFAALALSYNGYEVGTFARDVAFVTFGLLVGSIAKEFEIVVAVEELRKILKNLKSVLESDLT